MWRVLLLAWGAAATCTQQYYPIAIYSFTTATCNATRNLIPPYEVQTTKPITDNFACPSGSLVAPQATYTNLGFGRLGNNAIVGNSGFEEPFVTLPEFTEVPYEAFPSPYKTYEIWFSTNITPLPVGSYVLFDSFRFISGALIGFKVTYNHGFAYCDERELYLELEAFGADLVQEHFSMTLFQNATGHPGDFLEHGNNVHLVIAYLGEYDDARHFRVCIGVQGLQVPVCLETLPFINIGLFDAQTTTLGATQPVITTYQTTVYDGAMSASHVLALYNRLVFVNKPSRMVFQ